MFLIGLRSTERATYSAASTTTGFYRSNEVNFHHRMCGTGMPGELEAGVNAPDKFM